MSLQLKNAKQMQLAAEAAKRREEEILQAKAENQQPQPQQVQDDEQNRTELRSEVDTGKPAESVEQSVVSEQDQTSEMVSVVQLTKADEDTAVETVGDGVSGSEQVAVEQNEELAADASVCDEVEPNQRLPEADHHEMESAVVESVGDSEVRNDESSEKPENLEAAAVVNEVVPVVVVASSDEVLPVEDVHKPTEPSQPAIETDDTEDKCTSPGDHTENEQQSDVSAKLQSEQLATDVSKTKLDIADDVIRSVSDESSDAYTDVLEDETDHLSDILETQDKTKRKEDIEYVELCDESSSTVEPNANKEDNKEETEKELDSILDDVHLDESEHGSYCCV